MVDVAAHTGSEGRDRPRRREGPLRVVIVDDHDVLRAGTRQVLEMSEEIVVVGEADDGDSALSMIEALSPDLVLIDVQLLHCNGIEVARQLIEEHPAVQVVMLSAYDAEEFVRGAIEAGVQGYLLKTMPRDELVSAVRAAGQGITVLDPALLPRITGAGGPPGSMKGAALTWREREAARLVSDGFSNKAIAARLGVSVRTVEGHLNHVFAKLGVESRTELVRLVLTEGLMSPVSQRAD
ncbi:MAG: response regulator [Acidimicrobiales bacterium]